MKNFAIISVKTTFLEITKQNELQPKINFDDNYTIFIYKIPQINTSFYKFLYKEVGEKWGWSQRLLLNDNELEQIITHQNTFIFVLYIKGIPSGFAEYHRKDNENIELKYFGLIESQMGKGFGKDFLLYTLNEIWKEKIKRIFLQTCTLDAPTALTFYQKCGFQIFDRQICEEYYPISFLIKNQISF